MASIDEEINQQDEDLKEELESEQLLDDMDEGLIDLYSDFNEDVVLQSDKELEELKRIVQMDALRTYSFLRRNITILKLRAKNALKSVKPKNVATAGAFILMALGLGISIKHFWPINQNSSVLGKKDAGMVFGPLLPDDENDDSSADSYDAELEVYSYTDKIGEQNITVAQQPLPPTVRQRPEGAEWVAAGLSANGRTEAVVTAKGIVYIGTSSAGSQAAVFIYDEILVFINSLESFDEEALARYVNGLSI